MPALSLPRCRGRGQLLQDHSSTYAVLIFLALYSGY